MLSLSGINKNNVVYTIFDFLFFFIILKCKRNRSIFQKRLSQMFNKARGWFVEQKLLLSPCFRCFQIRNCKRHDFGHTVLLKTDLDVQQTHLRGHFVEQKLSLSSSFRCYQIHNCQRHDFIHTVLLK